jgi:hypothetical protein
VIERTSGLAAVNARQRSSPLAIARHSSHNPARHSIHRESRAPKSRAFSAGIAIFTTDRKNGKKKTAMPSHSIP